MEAVRKLIVSAVAGIQEEKAISLVRNGLARGMDPFMLLEEVRTGVEIVLERYNRGEYFLADVVMAADIYKRAQQVVLGPAGGAAGQGRPPQVVFGTVEKDIHDIGKNITIVTMRHYGLEVLDVGVNVSPVTFLEKLRQTGAPILCLSGLISDAYDSMKKTVCLIKRRMGKRRPVIVIGGLVNEVVCSYTGADYWAKNCTEGAELCSRLLKERGKGRYAACHRTAR
ncbi:MAG: cobalamin-binding protein [Firmicutes bacterium]|nr:cobalamin-binding protein [Bacillota bacterium]